MNIRFNIIIALCFFTSTKFSIAQTIHVNLFNSFNIKTAVVIPAEGKYQLLTEKGKIDRLKKNAIIYFTCVGDSISIWDADEHLGLFANINFMGLSKNNVFKVEPVYPSCDARFYEGDITIEAKNNALQIKNHVDINNYLAGVVEAEAGPNAPFEFYKAQAIISRTYLYEIIERDESGYYIGDDVNFQVYKGMCALNLNIRLAVNYTTGLVIIDSTKQLITAAFHSNSGGITANSEDVWLSPTDYLKETTDPFSLNQKNSIWVDSVKTSDWLKYFKSKGFNISSDSARFYITHINQKQRAKYLRVDKDTIAYKDIRKDFGFRSAWFSSTTKNEYIIITGRGYGHGVGLSQEGAMQMARENYSFLDIIYYYYKNVKVVHIGSAG